MCIRDRGIPNEDLRIDFAGLNHMVFGLHVYNRGVDITSQVIEVLCQYNEGKEFDKRFENLPYTPDFMRALHCIPSPYLRYYFFKDEMLKHAQADAELGENRAHVFIRLEKELF